MKNPLHLRARPDAPVSCDMSMAPDTPDERLREYHELFERALVRRERRADSVAFTFRADPGAREGSTTSPAARPPAARSSTTASSPPATRSSGRSRTP